VRVQQALALSTKKEAEIGQCKRPHPPRTAFVQLDDLKDKEQLDRVRPAAFIIHETSPANAQAWIAVSGVPAGKEEFKGFTRRVRKAVGGNDKSASHATRLAGTQNWKARYLPNPPTVRILEAHPGRIMTPQQLECLGLLAPPEPALSPTVVDFHPRRAHSSQIRERQRLDYQRCLAGAPTASSENGPSRSHADFFWCKMAAQRGWSVEETAEKLKEVSEKAQERVRCGIEVILSSQHATLPKLLKEAGRGVGIGSQSPLTGPFPNCTVQLSDMESSWAASPLIRTAR
jgi:RepB DNA-primase from phage plasmid